MTPVVPPQRGTGRLPAVRVDSLARLAHAVVIDLRSPSEFAEDHIPGAHNLPLFDDVQRALVGTLYRQVSPEAAFEEARHIVRGRIALLVGAIARLAQWTIPPEDLEARVLDMTSGGIVRLSSELECAAVEPDVTSPVLLHCWRGGLRSRSVVAFVRALGLDRAYVIEGGYKAYRARIVAEIDAFAPPPVFVLRGLTGVGKTLVLHEIERLRPGWTLDLEACAGHRSSLLGMVGLAPCSQRQFESRIAARLRQGFGDALVLEGESRKVGDALVPPRVWAALCDGASFALTAPIERRVAVLRADYASTPESVRELAQRLPAVEGRMPRRVGATSLVAMLECGEVDALARLLLQEYYDPLYRKSEGGRSFRASIAASDPERAAGQIVSEIDAYLRDGCTDVHRHATDA